MASYVDISRTDMLAFLSPLGFHVIDLGPSVGEIVYAKRIKSKNLDVPLSLRVYTSIKNGDGHGRDVGEDAIRVAIFTKKRDGTPVKLAGSKRVHRVQGWKKNLLTRINEFDDFKAAGICPKDGGLLVPRKAKRQKSTFVGCLNFPACRYSRNA
jgi:Topoisomerase DNA binding C4 zinc finger